MEPVPAPPGPTRIGMREITLLLIAAGFALLMMGIPRGGVVTGWLVVALWLQAMVSGPRPTPTLTATYGAGLFVMTFWWPRENWWQAAITLMWIGAGMLVCAAIAWLASRFRP